MLGCQLGLVTGADKFYVKVAEVEKVPGNKILLYSPQKLLKSEEQLPYYLTWKDGCLEFGRDEPGSDSNLILFKHLHYKPGSHNELKDFYEPRHWIGSIGFTAQASRSSFFSYDPNCYGRNFRDLGENYAAFDIKVLNATHNKTILRPENKSVLISFDVNVDAGLGSLIEFNLNETIPFLNEVNKDEGNFRSAHISSFNFTEEVITNQRLTSMKCDPAEMSQLCRMGQYGFKNTLDAKLSGRGFSFRFGPYDRRIFGFGIECTPETQESCETIWRPNIK
eukprot:TCALIF_08757-PA protein Name:"Protein of unknown function" AED:0.26 eAED:0.26 QI:0/0.25/0/0.6/1/1/5/0/278